MDKIAKLLVKSRYVLLGIFIVLAVVCGYLTTKVNINTDMTKYLPDSSQMRQGIIVLEDEFSNDSSGNATLKVMFDDLKEESKPKMNEALGKLEHVSMVEYSENSESFNKDNHTLYILSVDEQENVDTVINDIKELEDEFGELDYITHNNNMGGSLPSIIVIVLLVVVLVIMLIMCGSYIEPFLFLLTIGIAIVLNMGTNALLESVSSTTNGISSILQLVLSMDYSIILSNRYRQACKKNDNHVEAMTKAIKESIISVSSSAITTIVGLLSLLFMSFKIGGDLGFVLAKGVFFSLVCVFTVLPAIMLIFDKLVILTSKNPITIPMKGMARISYSKRYILCGGFIVILIAAFIGKFFAGIQYDVPEENEITKIFPAESKIVIMYQNSDEEKLPKLIEKVEDMHGVTAVQAYANTLGLKLDAKQLSGVVQSQGIDESIVRLLVYDCKADRSKEALTIEQIVQYVTTLLEENEIFSDKIDSDTLSQLKEYSWLVSKEALTKEYESDELAKLFGVDEKMISGVYLLLKKDSCSIAQLAQMLKTPVVQTLIAKQGIDVSMLAPVCEIISSIVDEKTYSADEIYKLVSEFTDEISPEYAQLLYEFYYSNNNYDESLAITMDEMFDTLLNSKNLATVITDEQKEGIKEAYENIASAKAQFVGEKYSRAIVTVNLCAGSDEMMDLVADIMEQGNDMLKDEYYIGNSVMAYEMEASFGGELNKITIITALAIFIVIAISFKSLIVPAILVMVIQASVYVTMSIMGIIHYDMNYLALLIMQCILMGATVDYAIVFTNYYREKRQTSPVLEALGRTYQSSIRTILTSGLIMAVATAVLGFTYHDSTIGPIVRIISAGVVSALILIIGFLPSILAVLDRFVVGKND